MKTLVNRMLAPQGLEGFKSVIIHILSVLSEKAPVSSKAEGA